MTFVKSPAKVLVTGANGFIAVWVVQVLIDRGYSVTGTVRSESKGTYLKEKFGDKFEFVVIGGLEVPDAFDEIIKSVNPDAIIHVASPVSFDATGDPTPMIRTAIGGTVGVLQSAQRFGPNVKRVVITSSVVAALESRDVATIFTEKDWNLESGQVVEREGENTPGAHRYRASKAKAEQAAWEFVDKNKDIHFDISTILPSVVFGPIIHEVKDVSSLNMTTAMFYNSIVNHIVPTRISNNYVDVRDVALAHVLALETPEAGGERFLVSRQRYDWQEFTEPLIQAGYKVKPIETQENSPDISFDNSKSKKVLGLEYTTLQKTAVDTYAELQKRFPESFP